MRTLLQYQSFISICQKLFIKNTVFEDEQGFEQILAENNRLIIVSRHSSPLSWLPVITTLGAKACELGHSQRVPIGVMHRTLHKIPLIADFAEYIAQGAPKDYKEALEVMNHFHNADLVLFPEGSNCFFGDSKGVQSFKSHKFVQMAAELEIPILMVNHTGSENWGIPVKLPKQINQLFKFVKSPFIAESLVTNNLLNIPQIPKPIENFRIWVELYKPCLKKDDLEQERSHIEERVAIDIDHIRGFFNSL